MLTDKQQRQPQPYYVYHLVDPRTDRIFYVGKGKGGRMKAHVSAVKNNRWDNEAKCSVIASILADGLDVIERVVVSDLDEAAALRIEREHILRYRESVTNLTCGYTRGPSHGVRAERLLGSMKSYEEWILTAPIETLVQVERVFGSTQNCYDFLTASLGCVVDRCEGHLNHG